jgi:hypothetical protein
MSRHEVGSNGYLAMKRHFTHWIKQNWEGRMATVDQRLERLWKSKKRYLLVPIIVVVLMQIMVSNVRAEIVQGDFDGNGVVDFPDFLVFAGNFGKTGDPYDPNTVVRATAYDTVKVLVEGLAPPDSTIDLSSLGSITASISSENWDADPQDDGLEYWLRWNTSRGSSNESPNAIVTVKIQVFTYESDPAVILGSLLYETTIIGQGGLVGWGHIDRIHLEPFQTRNYYVKALITTPTGQTFEDHWPDWVSTIINQ